MTSDLTTNGPRLRRMSTGSLLAACAGAAMAAAPAVAQAAPAPTELRSCVVDVPDTSKLACFDTFAEAIKYATGGRELDPPKDPAVAVRDPAFAERLNASSVAPAAAGAAAVSTVISIEFGQPNFGGSPLIWRGFSGNCSTSTGNTDYEVTSMPVGYDNWVSSFETFANCFTKHWEYTGFSGASVGYQGTRAQISAAMDNRTSSEQWS